MIVWKGYQGKLFKGNNLPRNAVDYASMPLPAAMESLFIMDPAKHPETH